jgi:hypothetical protein
MDAESCNEVSSLHSCSGLFRADIRHPGRDVAESGKQPSLHGCLAKQRSPLPLPNQRPVPAAGLFLEVFRYILIPGDMASSQLPRSRPGMTPGLAA